MENLYCYYRISDKGNPLGRTDLSGTFLDGLNRRMLFMNFIGAFGTECLRVIADNVSNDTVDFLLSLGIDPHQVSVTKLGNAGSFMYAIRQSLMEHGPEDIIYYVEDDYLHTQDAKQYIFEGIEIGHYVSLYDSLDKYIDTNRGGNNPLISGGGESTKVILGRTTHFKYTNATTGTFAAKANTIAEDYGVIESYCSEQVRDFLMFRYLITEKKRILVCPLPGKASHVGLELSPFVDWKAIVSGIKRY